MFSRLKDAVFELSLRFGPFNQQAMIISQWQRRTFSETTWIASGKLKHTKYLCERTSGRNDCILDNASFKLYSDCVYSILFHPYFYGISNQLPQLTSASKWISHTVPLHRKLYPWFVSNVTKNDWECLMISMLYGQLPTQATLSWNLFADLEHVGK